MLLIQHLLTFSNNSGNSFLNKSGVSKKCSIITARNSNSFVWA